MSAVRQELLDVLPNEGIILVAGGVRSGKSCLAYGLAESIHTTFPERKCYSFGLPRERAGLLPDWLEVSYDLDFADDSYVIADEAYMSFYSRDSGNARNKFMDKLSGLAAQKGVLALYLTQTTRKLEIALVSGTQAVLLKRPDVMQIELDRSELRRLLTTALSEFATAFREEKKGALGEVLGYVWSPAYKAATYVLSQDFKGLLRESNTPPSFWSNELSRAWKGVSLKKDGSMEPAPLVYDCSEPSCNQKASFICLCHQNAYCEAHGEGHERSVS